MSSENKISAVYRPGLIRVEGVSKHYRIYPRPIDRMREVMTLGLKRWSRGFQAVSEINLEITPGESVGIIGANGAGKSTLLQMICGTTVPSSGRVETHGRIYALLQLGAGFHPDFSGRENVYLSGAILGMTPAEVDECMGEILSFAEIGDFIEQPVRTYSSGMFVRLAFSVAVTMRPDILIIDEALSVGDAGFQRRCYNHIRGKLSSATRVFVTHEMPTLAAMTERVIVLSRGKVAFDGKPPEAIRYHERLMRDSSGQVQEAHGLPAGFEGVTVLGACLTSAGAPASFLSPGDPVRITLSVRAAREFSCSGAFLISDRRGLPVAGQSFGNHGTELSVKPGVRELSVDFLWPRLQGGDYVVSLDVDDGGGNGSFTADVATVTGGSAERHPGLMALDLVQAGVS
jgi:lipopolysaccharide transport system ATP-binding protein